MRRLLDGAGVLLLLMLVAGGCDRGVSGLDAADRAQPLMRKAASRERARDLDGAIELYEKVVYEVPSVALAHLHLGILLDDYRSDYVGALYHYRTYLRWRTESEKADMLKDRIAEAEKKLEAQFASRASGGDDEKANLRRRVKELEGVVDRLREEGGVMKKDNESQAREIDRLTRRLRMAENTQIVVDGSRGSSLDRVRDSASVTRTYTVVSGDSLTKISKKLCGSISQWKAIKNANSDSIGDDNKLKVGQVLVIPEEVMNAGTR